MCQTWLVFSLTAAAALSGCQTTGHNTPQTPPHLDARTPLATVLETGINFGGDTLEPARVLVTRRNEWPVATKLLEQAINDGVIKYTDPQLANAVHLYQSSPLPASPRLFERLAESGRPLARQFGWQIASTMPSKALAHAVEGELTRAVRDGEEASLLYPQVANAIAANHLVDSYTLLREGLMASGDEAFAQAMAKLAPNRASGDFLDYLAQAPVEELRQLTMTSVNPFTCMVIMRHLLHYPVAVSHPNFDHLFLFAISRNEGLADLAYMVLQNYLPRDKDQLALVLAQQPSWVQIAFIDQTRQRMSPAVGLFLATLKSTSARPEVIDEISDIRE